MSPISSRTLLILVVISTLSSISGASTVSTPDGNQLKLQPNCDPLPFTRETWQKLNIDRYLAEYPGGQKMTVQEYASSLDVKNFKCGVAQWCNAGQMCYPARDTDWYVLFAIQEWNERINALYTAIGYTMSLTRATLLGIAAALFPQPDNLRIFAQKTHFAMGAAFAGLLVGLISLVPFFIGMPSIIASWAAIIALIPASAITLSSALTSYHDSPKDAFAEWSDVVFWITDYEEKIHKALTNHTQSLLGAGISSPQGIAGVLAGGNYLDVQQFKRPEEIEAQLKNVTVGMSVSYILKSLNAFVTIGSDPCKSSGPDGAWTGDSVLSYCNSNGTMFNVIRARPGKSKAHNHIPHAKSLSTQFGITTEYLTSASIECQRKREHSGADRRNVTSAMTENLGNPDCIIDLPVCDCRSPEFQKRKKKVGVVKACREAGVWI